MSLIPHFVLYGVPELPIASAIHAVHLLVHMNIISEPSSQTPPENGSLCDDLSSAMHLISIPICHESRSPLHYLEPKVFPLPVYGAHQSDV